MKTILLIVFVFALTLYCTRAQTEWNKPIQLPPIESGGTSQTGIMNLSGIGAVINKKDGKCIITKFFEGSGAEVAGLKIDDAITHIDKTEVSNLDLPEIAALLRGDPDTTVVLTIVRGNEPPKNVTVTRHPVKIK